MRSDPPAPDHSEGDQHHSCSSRVIDGKQHSHETLFTHKIGCCIVIRGASNNASSISLVALKYGRAVLALVLVLARFSRLDSK
jgi:hypothetical protein